MSEIDYVGPLTERQRGKLPDHLGLEWLEAQTGRVRGRFTVAERHMAPNGFMHAGSVVTLADSACGYGCFISLPEGGTGFTTVELKTNFLGTGKLGDLISAQARLIHGGRSTQVWDAEVHNDTADKTIALFRCTQMVLYPR
ncbi:MAG: PaaI family thioesterase [Terricaulis sp.]